MRPRPAVPNAGKKREPVHLGHPLVADDEVELLPLGDLEAPDRRGRDADVHVRLRRERPLDQLQPERFVVDHQQVVGGPVGAHDSIGLSAADSRLGPEGVMSSALDAYPAAHRRCPEHDRRLTS